MNTQSMFFTFLPPRAGLQSSTVNNWLDWNLFVQLHWQRKAKWPLLHFACLFWFFIVMENSHCEPLSSWIKKMRLRSLIWEQKWLRCEALTEITCFSWTKGNSERSEINRDLFWSDFRDDFWSPSRGPFVCANKSLQTYPRAPRRHPRGIAVALFQKWKWVTTVWRLEIGRWRAVPL